MPFTLFTPVVLEASKAVVKLMSLIVPVCPAVVDMVPPAMSMPFMPPAAPLVVLTL